MSNVPAFLKDSPALETQLRRPPFLILAAIKP